MSDEFVKALSEAGLITSEQYVRTAELVVEAKAGEPVRIRHTSFLYSSDLGALVGALDNPYAFLNSNEAE